MLLNPITLTPFKSIAPYRDVVLTIGSPIVFHTAPPQPASNARITCPAVFAGGPLATPNGGGLKSPNPLWLARGPPADTAGQGMARFGRGWGGAGWETIGEPRVKTTSRWGARA